MFYCARARHIIIDAALHVETLAKSILTKNKYIKFTYNKRQLGKNIEQLYNKKVINKNIFDRLNYYKELLNFAKRETDPDNNQTFDSEDAIVFYFETRNIGNELLKILKHPTYGIIYEINKNF